jgi:hypothetical protein
MSFLTCFNYVLSAAGVVALVGCAAPTAQPTDGSHATLNVEIDSPLGQATFLSGDLPGILNGFRQQQLLLANSEADGGKITKIIQIPADQTESFDFDEWVRTLRSHCNVGFHLHPLPGETYRIVMGDVAPLPPATDFDSWLNRVGNMKDLAQCYVKRWHVLPDGSETAFPDNDVTSPAQ